MEFPLYQWSVVWVGNTFELPLAVAGRTVSLVCFYVMLPGLFLLLARMGIATGARWLALMLVVSCPLYIFYTRAFLIEAMALMLAVWFVAAFVAAMQTGRVGWMLLAAVAGIGAALVKVTTLMLWMAPAAVYGFLLLYRSRTRGQTEVLKTLLRGALLAAGPCVAAIWWVGTADAIKAQNPAGEFLMSGPMRLFNFGLWAERFSAETWSGILKNWHGAVMPLWLTVIGALAIGAAPSRYRVIGASGVAALLAAQLTFPRLFAWHDYYFYAVAVFWLGAVGIAVHALMDRVKWRAVGVVVVAGLLAVQLHAYWAGLYRMQTTSGNGGTGLTNALRELTPREGVLVVAGNDWSAMLPYYAQRRALMIRVSVERDPAFLETAFARLAGEEIGALVVTGEQRENETLITQASQAFDLHPSVAFSHADSDVYLPRDRRDWTVAKLRDAMIFESVVPRGEVPKHAATPAMDRNVRTVNPHTDRALFGHMSPMPARYHFGFDANVGSVDGQTVVGAHPDAELWFAAPEGIREIRCAFGIFAGAYERPDSTTDGVEFIIIEKRGDGTEKEILRRPVQPLRRPEDRGLQQVTLPCEVRAGSELIFMTRPIGNYAFDWAYWGPITLR
jgi:hypothetical protein